MNWRFLEIEAQGSIEIENKISSVPEDYQREILSCILKFIK